MFHVEQYGRLVSSEVARHVADIDLLLSPGQLDQITMYADELRTWNEKTNLTSVIEPREVAIKHFLDSFLGLKVLSVNSHSNILDIGSGAGFPGIPLKILAPDVELYLIDVNKKKVSFLVNLVGRLRLRGVKVWAKTIEEISRDPSLHSKFGNIVIRALNVDKFIEHLTVLLAPAGRIILYKGETLGNFSLPESLVLTSQLQFDLPLGYGQRTLTVLERMDSLKLRADVLRGTLV